MGVPEPGKLPLNPRREKVAELATHTAYRVWLDALPGVQAYGILLVPKNARGKLPGLIALHGHGGSAEIVAGFLDPNLPSGYRRFGETAVQRGYVVWCPYIYGFYSEENKPEEGPLAKGRNILNKKALIAGATIMGVELAKLRRGIDYLESLPEVDPHRIGMYGLSKGGHYTLYAAALDTRIRAAVVSGWFNHRTRKLLAPKTGPGMFWITYPEPRRVLPSRPADAFRRRRTGMADRAASADDRERRQGWRCSHQGRARGVRARGACLRAARDRGKGAVCGIRGAASDRWGGSVPLPGQVAWQDQAMISRRELLSAVPALAAEAGKRIECGVQCMDRRTTSLAFFRRMELQ